MIKIGIDLLLIISLLLLMPYSLLGEAAHEWIGMLMLFLFILHIFLNRRWLRAVGKGRYSSFRIFQTGLVIAMFLLMAGAMFSGILLSNYIFKVIKPVGMYMEIRQIHMFCTYWGFVVMSLHLGIHWNMAINIVGKLFCHSGTFFKWLAKSSAFLISGYGIYAFWKRQIGAYLFMKMHFAFYDDTETVMYFIMDYLAVMVLIAVLGYYISRLLKKSGKIR